jgi:hypothetical protein
VAAAVAIFTVMVGLPAVEAVQAFDAVVSTQLSKDAPVAAPAQVRGHSLVAWSSQIRWAEKMSLDVREAPKAPVAQKQPAGKEPVTRALPATPPASRMVLCDNAFSEPESSLQTPEAVIVLA